MDSNTNITFVLSDALDTLPINPAFNARLVGGTNDKTINLESDGTNQAAATGIQDGATVQFTGNSSDFTYNVNGTTVEVTDADGAVVAQVAGGTTGSTLKFADGSTNLAIDLQAQGLTLGGQTLTGDAPLDGATTNVITNSGDVSDIASGNAGGDTGGGDTGGGALTNVDLDAEGGTPQNPASRDAGADAFNFTDDVASDSVTEIANFGADDAITLSGVTAEDLNNGISSSSGNTVISFDDGDGQFSQITLVGVSGFFFDVQSFNSADVGDITFA